MSEKKSLAVVSAAVVSGVVCLIAGMIAGAGLGPLIFSILGFGPPMGGQVPAPAVKVLAVQESLLAPADEYIAHVEAVQDVAVRPEVTGKIEQIHFEEGTLVNAGDLLFTVDRSAYQATADAARAEMIRAEKRYERLKQADPRSVSAMDLESAESDWLRGKAAYDLAMVDLERTEIRAPVSGRIGTAMVKKGNYVAPGMQELTRIVQLDPIRVVFSQTDREYLAMRRRELAGDVSVLEAKVVLPDGSVFPDTGKKDFDDNAINPDTGTIAVRYVFDNPDGLLIPGGYVTARISNSAGESGIKIPQRALLLDNIGSYVLTVDEEGTVGMIRVETDEQVGPDIIIRSGLNPGDRIITEGVQKAVPGATVQVVGE